MYTTASQLLTRYGAESLAELGGQKLPDEVVPECLQALILQTSTSGFTAAEIADAQAALDAINAAIEDAQHFMDSYLGKHLTLPLDQAVIDASVIPRQAAIIVRHDLMVHGADEPTVDNYKNAVAWLRDVSKGTAAIGAEDAAQDGDVASGFRFQPGGETRDWSGF